MADEVQEHPAIIAARAIKQLHIDNIKIIDDGFVFQDKDGNNVNDKMRAACVEQIELCDQLIESVSVVNDQRLLAPIELMLVDAKATIEKALEEAKDQPLPEIGNYDNDTSQT